MNIVRVSTSIASVIITRTKMNNISLFKLRYLKAEQSKQQKKNIIIDGGIHAL